MDPVTAALVLPGLAVIGALAPVALLQTAVAGLVEEILVAVALLATGDLMSTVLTILGIILLIPVVLAVLAFGFWIYVGGIGCNSRSK